MALTFTLSVDLDALAEHLVTHYPPYGNDDLTKNTEFEHYREVLDNHVEQMMSGDSCDEAPELTSILFKHYTTGSITDILITRKPGYVSNNGKRSVIIPLVVIELNI